MTISVETEREIRTQIFEAFNLTNLVAERVGDKQTPQNMIHIRNSLIFHLDRMRTMQGGDLPPYERERIETTNHDKP